MNANAETPSCPVFSTKRRPPRKIIRLFHQLLPQGRILFVTTMVYTDPDRLPLETHLPLVELPSVAYGPVRVFRADTDPPT